MRQYASNVYFPRQRGLWRHPFDTVAQVRMAKPWAHYSHIDMNYQLTMFVSSGTYVPATRNMPVVTKWHF